MRKGLAAGALTGMSGILGVRPAQAAWPTDRPVRVTVPASAGGTSDIAARIMSQALQNSLGGSFVVENRAGAGGNLGMLSAIRAEPDGYTLLVTTSIWVVNPSLFSPRPFDPYSDLVPVCEIAVSPTVFVVAASSNIHTLADLVAVARADPAKFNIAVPPFGSMLHLAAETLKFQEKLDGIAITAYAGGGQAIQAVLAGTVQLCSSTLAPALPHIQAGTLRPIAIIGESRISELPNVPTAIEAGYKDFNFETYTSLMIQPKAPENIRSSLEQKALELLKSADLNEKYQRAGFQVTARTGEEHTKRIKREVPLFRGIITNAGIKV